MDEPEITEIMMPNNRELDKEIVCRSTAGDFVASATGGL